MAGAAQRTDEWLRKDGRTHTVKNAGAHRKEMHRRSQKYEMGGYSVKDKCDDWGEGDSVAGRGLGVNGAQPSGPSRRIGLRTDESQGMELDPGEKHMMNALDY